MPIHQSLSPHRTNALRGVAAILIYVFHVLLQLYDVPLFNFVGGLCVAVFLIVSGYGINESYRKNRLDAFWEKRLAKVILPTFVFVCCFSLVFPDGSMESCVADLTYTAPTYWFIFHVVKCYAAYYIARKCCGRYWLAAMAVWAVFCLNYRSCGIHFESEQAFSFLAGVLMSEYGERIDRIPRRTMKRMVVGLFLAGLCCYAAKIIPAVHQYKNPLLYNSLLCPFCLSWGLVVVLLPIIAEHGAATPAQRPTGSEEGTEEVSLRSAIRAGCSRVLAFCGRHSLEIYVAHMPLIGLIHDLPSAAVFVACSVLSCSLLIFYTRHLQHRLGCAGAVMIGINALFVAKYGARLTDLWPYVTMVWMLLTALAVVHLLPWMLSRARMRRTIAYAIPICMAGMVALQCAIDPYSIQVDRWSALHFPISNMLHGDYPYLAQTHLGGYASPFPVWQILHIPFYLIGNVGLSFLPAMLFFLWTISRYQGRRALLLAGLLLVGSPAVWYEIAVRSDLLTNFLLLGAVINMVCHNLSLEWVKRHYVALAVVIALMASTRLLTILPFAILFLPYYFRMKASAKVAIPIVFLTVFVATFVPFAVWDPDAFFYHQHNPWSLQTRQGHALDFAAYVPLAFAFALTWKVDVSKYHRNTALFLICFVAISMLHRMYDGGNWDLFSSAYDITYFDAVIPFAILAWCNHGSIKIPATL